MNSGSTFAHVQGWEGMEFVKGHLATEFNLDLGTVTIGPEQKDIEWN